MNRFRMAALAALTVCAVSLGAAGTASAAQEPAKTPLTKTVALTGTKGFKGTYKIDRFASKSGKLVAIGTLKGTMRKAGKTKRVSKSQRRHARLPWPAPRAGARPRSIPPIPGACTDPEPLDRARST